MAYLHTLANIPLGWLVPAVGLLAMPGPTNTLMATTGASVGVSRSLPLITAEIAGYLTAIVGYVTLLGPLVAAQPALGAVLKLGCGVYLAYMATKLWMSQPEQHQGVPGRPITYGQVLVTTLLNPKAMLFAFAIIPFDQSKGIDNFIGLLAIFTSIVMLAATGWILAGATMRLSLNQRQPTKLIPRISSIAIGFFSTAIIYSSISMYN